MEPEKRIKYKKTYHHPLSEEVKSDDKIISASDLAELYGKEYVGSIKMDGECTTIYETGATHARSKDSIGDESNSWVRGLAARIAYSIPENHRYCGENMHIQHSIKYEDLESFFLAFGVWQNVPNVLIDWDTTLSILNASDVKTVPIVWRGILTPEIIEELWRNLDKNIHEGLVFRPVEAVPVKDFHKKVFKLVRRGHVQTDKHWKHKQKIKNKMA